MISTVTDDDFKSMQEGFESQTT